MKKVRLGFTLIELSLSLIFIGILSVSVVLIINNTMAAYRRGMTLNHINTVGMDMVDEMRTSVQNASSRSISAECTSYYSDSSMTEAPRNVCLRDGGYNFVSVTQGADVTIEDGSSIGTIPVFGAFCTGTYSYIWNSGYFTKYDGDGQRQVHNVLPATLTYLFEQVNPDGTTSKVTRTASDFRILKVRDEERAVCVSVVRKYDAGYGRFSETYTLPSQIPNDFDITAYRLVTEEPVEILLTDDYSDLVIYDLEVARPAESSTRLNAFYSASFILGTVRGGINILGNGKSCQPPSDYKYENFDYCAINKFNFAVQAGGDNNV